MDIFKELKEPIEIIELSVKIMYQSAVVFVGVFGNLWVIRYALTRSKLPWSTNHLISSLSWALILQALTATIDFADSLYLKEDHYSLGYFWCDTWNALNVYIPMLMALMCFWCLLDRLTLLTRPENHSSLMNLYTVSVMVLSSFLVPALVTLPPLVFGWYTTEDHIRKRPEGQCKFAPNVVYALISPLFTFWTPVLLNALVIVKIFKAMAAQDQVASVMATTNSCEKLPNDLDLAMKLPYEGRELRRQHRLVLSLWSVYWNVALFWMPHFVWLVIYKVTGADWPKATNFMPWAGYMPCFIIPGLYHYYNVFEM